MQRSVQTRDWTIVRVFSRPVPGAAAETLDLQPVSVAVVAKGVAPVSGDWVTATWVETAGVNRPCRAMTGPGTAHTYTAGEYTVWCKVDDGTGNPLVIEPAYDITYI